MAIVIKKRISLEFIGDEYKDASLTFQAIPLKDFDEIVINIEKAQADNSSVNLILSTLKTYFIEGEFPGMETVTSTDLDGLDPETVIHCFQILTGQDTDPKVLGQEPMPSQMPSSTTEVTQP